MDTFAATMEKDWYSGLVDLVKKDGGPEPSDYRFLNRFFRMVGSLDSGEKRKATIRIREIMANVLCVSTMQGRSLEKPRGYAGDFETIERIYSHTHTSNSSLRGWDEFFLTHAAAQAVRNRRQYFVDLLNKSRNETRSVLNVGSGPGRDLADWLKIAQGSGPSIHCLDLDGNALAFTEKRCQGLGGDLSFHESNLFRYRPCQSYDLIWSAGLFDYLNDRMFVLALRRMLAWLSPGGKIVVGNFGTFNPSRDYMEIAGDWHLLHRSKEELLNLAKTAGVSEEESRVEAEGMGVNLFLHIEQSSRS